MFISMPVILTFAIIVIVGVILAFYAGTKLVKKDVGAFERSLLKVAAIARDDIENGRYTSTQTDKHGSTLKTYEKNLIIIFHDRSGCIQVAMPNSNGVTTAENLLVARINAS